MLKLSIAAGLTSFTVNTSPAKENVKSELRTPRQTEGPFYPIHQQQDKDTDLTKIQGRPSTAKGKVIHVKGKIINRDGEPLENAFVEIWQANTWGRYRHIRDPNRTAAIDPDFQGWGQTNANAEGRYAFKTILPGAYPAGPDWTRPPHIHFKVAMPDYYQLTTQMYFPGYELNKIDKILQSLPVPQQKMLIANPQDSVANGEPVFIFDIVLIKKS